MPKSSGVEVIGQKYGRLIVQRLAGMDQSHKSTVEVICECGQVLVVRLNNLRTGTTKSCGCLGLEAIKRRSTKHGLSHDDRFQVWVDMHKRCYSVRCPSYPNYGGRGITVHESWHHTPEKFFVDMGKRPHGYTLDRVDNDKGYGPGNCRWASMSEQQNNKRTNINLEWEGLTKTISEWSRYLGIHKSTIHGRYVSGMDVGRVLSGDKLPPANQFTK